MEPKKTDLDVAEELEEVSLERLQRLVLPRHDLVLNQGQVNRLLDQLVVVGIPTHRQRIRHTCVFDTVTVLDLRSCAMRVQYMKSTNASMDLLFLGRTMLERFGEDDALVVLVRRHGQIDDLQTLSEPRRLGELGVILRHRETARAHSARRVQRHEVRVERL